MPDAMTADPSAPHASERPTIPVTPTTPGALTASQRSLGYIADDWTRPVDFSGLGFSRADSASAAERFCTGAACELPVAGGTDSAEASAE